MMVAGDTRRGITTTPHYPRYTLLAKYGSRLIASGPHLGRREIILEPCFTWSQSRVKLLHFSDGSGRKSGTDNERINCVSEDTKILNIARRAGGSGRELEQPPCIHHTSAA